MARHALEKGPKFIEIEIGRGLASFDRPVPIGSLFASLAQREMVMVDVQNGVNVELARDGNPVAESVTPLDILTIDLPQPFGAGDQCSTVIFRKNRSSEFA